jgi:beta-barrel assembly-enhancing protease
MPKALPMRWISAGRSDMPERPASRPTAPEPAIYFDGQTALRRQVQVILHSEHLGITPIDPPGKPFHWPLVRIRALAGGRDKHADLTLTCHADTDDESPRDPARLTLASGPITDWLRSQPTLTRRDLRRGTWGKVALYLGGAMAAVALILLVFLPRIADEMARRMPIEREVAFGQAVIAQMERLLGDGDVLPTCDDPAGRRALEVMRARLTAGQGLRYDLTLRVLDTDMVNAFAAPGGQVVILRGLLDEAASPAEVAGVLAHEIGHVEARDPTRLAFRAVGSAGILSLVLGDATGGTLIAIVGDQMLSAAYTREAEAAADAFAHRLLSEVGIGTEGLATFFDRIDGEGLDLPEYLSTHPITEGRANAARAVDQGAQVPVMSDAQWKALKGICG